ncbi:MAG: lysophospholipid acyltransferase family protein [Candidatus Auribacterota bacterium]
MKKTIYYIQYLLARSACGFLNLIPYRIVCALGRMIGCLGYYLSAKRRAITLDNLREAFGCEYTDPQLHRIARQSFSQLILLLIEFVRIPKLLKDFSRYVTIVRKEIVWQGLEKGNGVILLVSHFGNWELMAIMAGVIGYPISAVGRPMKNPYIYDYVMSLRGMTGLKSLPKKGAAKELMRELRNNRVVAILFDQYAGSAGEVVPFFGRPAYTTTAVAQLALRTGAEVIPAYNVRQPDGTHRIYVDDPIPLTDTGDKAADYISNTLEYNRNLEKWIRQYPSQWFWFHRRWKKPRGARKQETAV